MLGFFGKSPLVKAIEKWIRHGGSIREIIPKGVEGSVNSTREANLVCAALDALCENRGLLNENPSLSSLHTLVNLFQRVKDPKALAVLKQEGLPRLRRVFRDHLEGKHAAKGDAMFVLKILAMYRQREDVDLIARAARNAIDQEDYRWSIVLGQFDLQHPFSQEMIDLLRAPLPRGFLSVCYLDMANALAAGGGLKHHPFDSVAGHEQLESWLRDSDEECYSYAQSATAALPFVASSARLRLLRIATTHPAPAVRLEAAWAQARCGDPDGLVHLEEYCLDPRYSRTAKQYLQEIGHPDRIPEKAREPEAEALAEMAAWLAHPMEFGRPPDEIELYDAREIYWPPTSDKRRVWLMKYAYNDDSGGERDCGIGMVGSITFALFGETTLGHSPEDVYALHCCWELEMNKDRRAPEKRTAAAGRAILRRHNAGF